MRSVPAEILAVATILRKLPFYEDQRTLRIPGGPAVLIKHHQIIVWVSITQAGLSECPVDARRFPAVFDTGFNDTFLIQEEHFAVWAGLSAQVFSVLDFLSAYGQRVPLLDADVWLHRNRPGHRDQFYPQSSFRLEMNSGIGVCPAPAQAPRLPLLGVLGLRRANLQGLLDCDRCRLSLRTPRRFWFFG